MNYKRSTINEVYMKWFPLLIIAILVISNAVSAQAMGTKTMEPEVKYKINGKYVGQDEFEAFKTELSISKDCASSDFETQPGVYGGWEMTCGATHKTNHKTYTYSEYEVAGAGFKAHEIKEKETEK